MNKLLAQVTNGETVDIAAQTKGFFGFTCVAEFVMRLVDVAIIGSGLLLLGFLIWGGLEWIMSGGDKGKIESARGRLTNALVGVAITASAYALWRVVLMFFGISAPNICTANPFS